MHLTNQTTKSSRLHEGGTICLQSLDFTEIPIEARTTRGVLYKQWVRVGMPRIPPDVIDTVFFLYESVEDAKAGRNPGGTGFIVQDHIPRRPLQLTRNVTRHYYAITNWHVAVSGIQSPPCPVIRLNTNDGTPDIVELDVAQWEFLPGKYDVAVTELEQLTHSIHRYSSIPTSMFLSETTSPEVIGAVGDDVFMLGLFIDHDGVTTNVPSARFGNISMMPNESAKIEQETEYSGVSYIVDMHSRSGFSGSPVFVYRTFGSDLENRDGFKFFEIEMDSFRPKGGRIKTEAILQFLGIHWAQFPEEWELLDEKTIAEAGKRRHLIRDGQYIQGMSGMTCVIPSWQIMEVLDMPKLKARREIEHKKKRLSRPVSEKAHRSRLSLHPLPLETALSAALQTGRAPTRKRKK
jgi:hypothetical protein